jgi:mono/diheme cytochrome c family protein
MRVFSFVFIAALGVLLLSGCRALPPSKPPSQWTAEEARGAQIFEQKCARCHSPNTTHRLKGPGLQAITKIGAPPFGAPLSDERIAQLVEHGRLSMPATPLNASQMKDLLAYLHAL